MLAHATEIPPVFNLLIEEEMLATTVADMQAHRRFPFYRQSDPHAVRRHAPAVHPPCHPGCNEWLYPAEVASAVDAYTQ